MGKPFDVSIEQLAHDLALLITANFPKGGGDGRDLGDYYRDYVMEYAMFKDLIEEGVKTPKVINAK